MKIREWLFGVGIILHLLVILLLPNRFLFVTQQFKSWFNPYANLFALNSPWQFFSPEPATPLFYEYDVIGKEDQSVRYYFPELPNQQFQPFSRARYNRKIALVRILTRSPPLFEQLFIPFLCRSHPEAQRLRITRFTVPVPSLTSVKQGQPLIISPRVIINNQVNICVSIKSMAKLLV